MINRKKIYQRRHVEENNVAHGCLYIGCAVSVYGRAIGCTFRDCTIRTSRGGFYKCTFENCDIEGDGFIDSSLFTGVMSVKDVCVFSSVFRPRKVIAFDVQTALYNKYEGKRKYVRRFKLHKYCGEEPPEITMTGFMPVSTGDLIVYEHASLIYSPYMGYIQNSRRLLKVYHGRLLTADYRKIKYIRQREVKQC